MEGRKEQEGREEGGRERKEEGMEEETERGKECKEDECVGFEEKQDKLILLGHSTQLMHLLYIPSFDKM